MVAIIRAHWSFFRHFAKWLQKRKLSLAPPGNPKANQAGIFKGSIVISYFLKDKKKFSDL
jgi:hypothetical protein